MVSNDNQENQVESSGITKAAVASFWGRVSQRYVVDYQLDTSPSSES